MTVIYFGGLVQPALGGGPLSYDRNTDLDALDEVAFHVAFVEWVTQCWLHDNQVPNDAGSLANFELDELIPEFRRDFAAGSWKRLIPGRGTTAEEYVLYLQLVNKGPIALVLNREQPQQALGRVRHRLMLSEAEIGACLIAHLAEATSDTNKTPEGGPVMLYDGRVGHVITVRAIDDAREWISFDDPTWPRNKSMLCEGENEAGVEAHYFGETEVGQWIVHVVQLPRVLFAVPIAQDSMGSWKDCARQWNKLLRGLYGD